MDLPTSLRAITGLAVADDPATLQRASRDASLFQMSPQAVVYPTNASQLGELVRFAAQHAAAGVSLTPRAAGTDMSGGPLSRSVVVDMTRHFHHILAVGSAQAITQSGVYYRDFEAATLKQGWLMPAYPASRDLCTIGGMVANNAGGEKSLQYGKVDRYVTALKAVLADGNEYVIEPLEAAEATAKMRQKDFEGELYYRLAKLMEKNEAAIAASRPRVSKNSSGYNIWDVWDGQRFDLTKLLIGSQGTLGIITEITLRLIKPKPFRHLLVIFLPDLHELARVVTAIMRYRPETFESYDNHTISVGLRHFPSVLGQIPLRSLLGLFMSVAPQLLRMLTGKKPALVLMAEFSGEHNNEVLLRTQAAQAALKSFTVTSKIVRSPAEMATYWAVRRGSFNLLRLHAGHQQTAPFIDDICVQPEHLPAFLPALHAIMGRYDIVYTIAGHVGDGNFHIIPLMDLADPAARTVIEKLGDEVFALVLKYGGSLSGEHNDGLIRSHYLSRQFGAATYQVFKEIKHIFDPHDIFNPGKKIGVDWENVKQYIITG